MTTRPARTGAYHPAPSFSYVIEGEIKLERHNKTEGCFEMPVDRAGGAYSEVAPSG